MSFFYLYCFSQLLFCFFSKTIMRPWWLLLKIFSYTIGLIKQSKAFNLKPIKAYLGIDVVRIRRGPCFKIFEKYLSFIVKELHVLKLNAFCPLYLYIQFDKHKHQLAFFLPYCFYYHSILHAYQWF